MDLMPTLVDIAKQAGDLILSYYKDVKSSSSVTYKQDGSPLTLADQASHSIICSQLKKHFPWPVLSEESPVEYPARKEWQKFWSVDPLDGTKDFIAGNDEFAVNIALIENGRPVLGLIYAPALDELYFAKKNEGTTLTTEGRTVRLPAKQCSSVVAASSRFHDSDHFNEFLIINGITSSVAVGSSLKFGKLAAGEISIYPRFVGSSEWDIAAGQIIIQEAGCEIYDLTTKTQPIYNKTSLRNNYFIALNRNLLLSDFKLPKELK